MKIRVGRVSGNEKDEMLPFLALKRNSSMVMPKQIFFQSK